MLINLVSVHVRASHQGEDDRVEMAKLKSAMSDVQRDEDGEISHRFKEARSHECQ